MSRGTPAVDRRDGKSFGFVDVEEVKVSKRTETVELTMTPDEKVVVDAAAGRAGLPTGTWVRLTALAEARAETDEARGLPRLPLRSRATLPVPDSAPTLPEPNDRSVIMPDEGAP